MATARQASPKFAHSHRAAGLAVDLADLLRTLKALCDPYRPELHYMRGPGPKWHARNTPAPTARASAIPDFQRTKA